MARKGPKPGKGGPRSGRSDAALTVVSLSDAELAKREIPPPPQGLLRSNRELWTAIWESDVVGRALDPVTDYPAMYVWVNLWDEFQRVNKAARSADRLVPGSRGQMTLNPLWSHLKDMRRDLLQLSREMGMTPLARMSLGLVASETQLNMVELNKRLAESIRARTQEDDPEMVEIMAEFAE